MNFESLSTKSQLLNQQLLYALGICTSLDEELRKETEDTEFISENAEEFAFLLRNLLGVLITHLRMEYRPSIIELESTQYQDNDSKADAFRRLEERVFRITRIAAELTPLIKFVYGSRVEKNPWGLIGHINYICRSFYPPARILIRPRWQYDYSYFPIMQELLKISHFADRSDFSVYTAISKFLSDSPYFFSLAYPPTAAADMLHTAIWAHEIGHLIDNIEGLKIIKEETATGYLSRDRVVNFETKIDFEALQIKDISNGINEPFANIIQNWSQEIFADYFSIQLFGPAALFAAVEFMLPLSKGLDRIVDPFYPPLRIRLDVMLKSFERWQKRNLKNLHVNESDISFLRLLDREISYLRHLIQSTPEQVYITDRLSREDQLIITAFYPYLVEGVADVVELFSVDIDRVIEDNQDCFLSGDDVLLIFSGINDLKGLLPPSFPFIKAKKFLPLLLNSGWLYWLSIKQTYLNPESGRLDHQLAEYQDINTLLKKSIENAEAERWFSDRRRYGNRRTTGEESAGDNTAQQSEFNWLALALGGMITKEELQFRIEGQNLKIRPLLDKKSQIGTCSVDIRLSNEFIITKKPEIIGLDPLDLEVSSKAGQFESKIYLPFGKPFALHPGQFILGSTLEYLAVPDDVMGLLLNRTSWARLGLIISTPYKIIPGFKGCITLELTNIGNAPILLYPCSRIGQIIFMTIRKPNQS